jgi:hypothetical protein
MLRSGGVVSYLEMCAPFGVSLQLGMNFRLPVRVFERIRDGIWVHNGMFALVDGWQETQERTQVFKFELRLVDEIDPASVDRTEELDHDRVIPTGVKLEVWETRGAAPSAVPKLTSPSITSSRTQKVAHRRTPKIIQILCARRNLAKCDNIG